MALQGVVLLLLALAVLNFCMTPTAARHIQEAAFDDLKSGHALPLLNEGRHLLQSSGNSTNGEKSKSGGGGGGGVKWWMVFIPAFIIAHLPCIPLIWWLAKRRKARRSVLKGGHLSMKIQDHFVKAVTLKEINKATKSFSQDNLLGEGGYGQVYKGVTPDGTVWAVKRSSRTTTARDLAEFQNEVDVISQTSHRNLVQLLGFCDDGGEQILVYEYMSKGTLRQHLQLDKNVTTVPLTWNQRLDIAIGAARGLHYLHSFAREPIIHRDVKSDNILLDSTLQAKVADFGLLKNLPMGEDAPKHVTTRVAGTFGYLDPEYQEIYRITAKSDVYSFGVVLVEIFTGKGPIIPDPDNPTEHISLIKWVVPHIVSARVENIVDPAMPTTYNAQDVHRLGTVALSCLARDASNRPDMEEVVRKLEDIKAAAASGGTLGGSVGGGSGMFDFQIGSDFGSNSHGGGTTTSTSGGGSYAGRGPFTSGSTATHSFGDVAYPPSIPSEVDPSSNQMTYSMTAR